MLDGGVQRFGQREPVRVAENAVFRMITVKQWVIIPAFGILFQVVRRVDEVDPAAELIEDLTEDAPALLVREVCRRVRHQRREGLCRHINRGAARILQRRARLEMQPHRRVEARQPLPCPAVSTAQKERSKAVFKSAPKAVVGDVILQLPPGEDHGPVRRGLERRRACLCAAALAGMHGAAPHGAGLLVSA